jgi:hypothetical protein
MAAQGKLRGWRNRPPDESLNYSGRFRLSSRSFLRSCSASRLQLFVRGIVQSEHRLRGHQRIGGGGEAAIGDHLSYDLNHLSACGAGAQRRVDMDFELREGETLHVSAATVQSSRVFRSTASRV